MVWVEFGDVVGDEMLEEFCCFRVFYIDFVYVVYVEEFGGVMYGFMFFKDVFVLYGYFLFCEVYNVVVMGDVKGV